MGPRELIRLEAELEYGVLLRGDVIPVTPENTANVSRMTVVRHADGYEMFFREGLSEAERVAFDSLSAELLFTLDVDEVTTLGTSLGTRYPIVDCRWYWIRRVPDPAEFPDVVRRDGRFVVLQNEEVAAEAWSSQCGARAEEVEVETRPEFRRRGYARQVVAAWTHAVLTEGKIALYSHLTANDASRALAASVGATWYADTREYV
ncbi:MAG TPA: GNAT family N-acetyltransferase [Nitrolancea sp.]|nr:GNAT family N-acetyltransferase [Nitrolancea sp.]